MPVKRAPIAARSRPLRGRRGPPPSGPSPTGTGYQCQSSSLESRRPMTKSGNSNALRPGRDALRPGRAGDYWPRKERLLFPLLIAELQQEKQSRQERQAN